jgi:hypothetical protein
MGPVFLLLCSLFTHCRGDSAAAASPISIKILSFARPQSLRRLLASAELAFFDGDRVALDIRVDGLPDGADAQLTADRAQVIEIAQEFSWPHGEKSVSVRPDNVHLAQQWLDAWVPPPGEDTDATAALIVEDDLELSPQFYRWAKRVHSAYRGRSDVVGASLQRPTLVPQYDAEGGLTRTLAVENGHAAFLYRLPGSWGFMPFAGPWRSFLAWQRGKASDGSGFQPYVRGLVTSDWHRDHVTAEGDARKMWEQWLIRYCDDRGLFTAHANLAGEKTLGSCWQEKGTHNTVAAARKDFGVAYSWESGTGSFPVAPQRYGWAGELLSERERASTGATGAGERGERGERGEGGEGGEGEGEGGKGGEGSRSGETCAMEADPMADAGWLSSPARAEELARYALGMQGRGFAESAMDCTR